MLLALDPAQKESGLGSQRVPRVDPVQGFERVTVIAARDRHLGAKQPVKRSWRPKSRELMQTLGRLVDLAGAQLPFGLSPDAIGVSSGWPKPQESHATERRREHNSRW
jgi:hypothetical protein